MFVCGSFHNILFPWWFRFLRKMKIAYSIFYSFQFLFFCPEKCFPWWNVFMPHVYDCRSVFSVSWIWIHFHWNLCKVLSPQKMLIWNSGKSFSERKPFSFSPVIGHGKEQNNCELRVTKVNQMLEPSSVCKQVTCTHFATF